MDGRAQLVEQSVGLEHQRGIDLNDLAARRSSGGLDEFGLATTIGPGQQNASDTRQTPLGG